MLTTLLVVILMVPLPAKGRHAPLEPTPIIKLRMPMGSRAECEASGNALVMTAAHALAKNLLVATTCEDDQSRLGT